MAGGLMPVLTKTLAELTTAIQEGRVIALWGTALIAYAIVMNRSATVHTAEMWSVTP
jgi:hypothetical protein